MQTKLSIFNNLFLDLSAFTFANLGDYFTSYSPEFEQPIESNYLEEFDYFYMVF